MLQYAVPSAQQTFPRPPSVVVDPPSRSPRSICSPGLSNLRPPSRNASQTPANHHRPYQASQAGVSPVEDTPPPALSTLASIAANAPAAAVIHPPSNSGDSSRCSTPSNSHPSMASTQFAPAATAGGTSQNSPPVCANCSTSTTPLWRRDESGSVLCNACGLFLKLHGRPRPISLKTDVIKSRNRVKTSQPKKRDSNGGMGGHDVATNGYAAAHPDIAHAAIHHGHVHASPVGVGADASHPLSSPGPGSRSNTPALAQQHASNIAPQHLFDTVSMPSDSFASPSLPSFQIRQPSPAPSLLNTPSSNNMDPPQNYEALMGLNNTLRTRVSELEVINDLFRGRVSELEGSEHDARLNERLQSEQVQQLNAELQSAHARIEEMQKRLAELATTADDGPARKKPKTEAADNVASGGETGESDSGTMDATAQSTATAAVPNVAAAATTVAA